MPQRDSQTADETDATSDGGSASLQTTARALGVALATIFVALHLYHHLPNPATIYVCCWPVRILAFAVVWNSLLKGTVIEGLVAACNQTERGLGPGAVLAKVIMLIIMALCVLQPWNCGEYGSVRRGHEEGKVAGGQ
jgi:hypothetical protein